MGGRDRTLHVAVAAVRINDFCRRHSCLVSRSSTGSAWSLYVPPTVCSECAAGVSRQRSKVASLNPGRRLDCKNCLTPDCGAVRLAKLPTEAFRSRSRCSELQLPLSFFPKTTSERPEATASPAEAKNTVMQWWHPPGWHLHTSEKKTRAALKGFTRRA